MSVEIAIHIHQHTVVDGKRPVVSERHSLLFPLRIAGKVAERNSVGPREWWIHHWRFWDVDVLIFISFGAQHVVN